ncbi:antA/AntB antirepressor family protein [Bartonella sp. CB74]|uniref:antA/AntB antirepressor family protein n=1 Tax=Bartonella sp. CB74 TaxID=3113620 RepID=UPI002F962CA0
MNTLIPISKQAIGQETVQTVNARELHAFLEVKTNFKDWIIRRIQDYKFQEGYDFCSFLSESSGGRPSKDYALTLDMAKELAMVERNEKGKQARQYFIECERRAKEVSALQIDYSNPEASLFLDNIVTMCLMLIQVPNKHLKSIADRLPIQSFLRALKALTHCMSVTYSGLVGCSYVIQYPYGESVTTDYRPCLLAPDTLFRVSLTNI